jgi:leucyl aminopeptidase (aminopeptidase T)
MLRSGLVPIGLGVVLSVSLAPQTGHAQGAAPDTDAFAKAIVTTNLGVTEGEKVLIVGPAREMELLEDLAFHVRNVGAFPLLTVTSDRLMERESAELPSRYDSQTHALELALMDLIDVELVVAPDMAPELLAKVPPERLAAQFAAYQPIEARARGRNVRSLEIGNSLAPTEWRAEQAGMTKEALAAVYWDGIAVDYAELERTGQAVRERLERGREVHVTHPNGTDLRFQIEDRQVFVNDGVISEEDRERGGAAVLAWIPAGEAYTTAVPGTAVGVIVTPETSFLDDPAASSAIRNLRVEFRDGRVVSMTGEGPGFAAYQALYEAAGEGREAFGVLDIGLNPRIRLPEGSRLGSFLPAGGVTLVFGGNVWAGGENDVAWGDARFLTGATVTVDGQPLVQEGRLTP